MSSKSIEDFLAFLRDAEQQYNKKSFYEHDKMLSDDKLEKAIKAVSAMDTKSGASQSVYVIEECSELIKELTKQQRGKGSEKDILAEACDVLTTVFVLLSQYGVSRIYVRDQILYKCNRALERYNKTGEV
ncbi:hypothetical protein D3Z52_12865 [Clostridiaceae bacterium]|nr:hypothetical protein [Clostridiaceae bacterium]